MDSFWQEYVRTVVDTRLAVDFWDYYDRRIREETDAQWFTVYLRENYTGRRVSNMKNRMFVKDAVNRDLHTNALKIDLIITQPINRPLDLVLIATTTTSVGLALPAYVAPAQLGDVVTFGAETISVDLRF